MSEGLTSYQEKLRHPKWQKKRLEILEREGFKCQCCQDPNTMLQVHHLVYSRGEPWDTPNEALECLCWSCHDFREAFNNLMGGRSLAPTRLCYHWWVYFKPVFDGSLKGHDAAMLIKDWQERARQIRYSGKVNAAADAYQDRRQAG